MVIDRSASMNEKIGFFEKKLIIYLLLLLLFLLMKFKDEFTTRFDVIKAAAE